MIEGDDHQEPLRLRARSLPSIQIGLVILLAFALLLIARYWRYGGLQWWELPFFALLAAPGLFAVVNGLVPTELTADRAGLRWRQLFYDRVIGWEEIDSIGISTDRNFDGYDRPVVRCLSGGRVPKAEPALGINLKIGDRNPATVSYRRGASGFELNFRPPFSVGLQTLVEALQTRLHQAQKTEG